MKTEDAIRAIEQESKFTLDACEGNVQYRKGYVKALRSVVDFLIATQTPGLASCPAVDRLTSFAAWPARSVLVTDTVGSDQR
jgi:hypothetical protein